MEGNYQGFQARDGIYPLRIAHRAAREFSSVIVLTQGPQTVLCAAEGRAYLNTGGNVGLRFLPKEPC